MAADDSDPFAPDADAATIVALFNETFGRSENTVLVDGGTEPLYQPADATHPCHRILFANGFAASALHEVAHWCIAGPARRRLVDYGYWYQPDGRGPEAQRAFEAAEEKPQAIEWAFSLAAGRPFHVSLDNLGDAPVDRDAFAERVRDRLRRYAATGFPRRAERFLRVLEAHYGNRFSPP